MTYILLIRHGQNDWVSKQRLAGWLPGVHLNDLGWQQAEELSERIRDLPLSAIYSSPLERCLETARVIAKPHNLEVISLEELGEVRYGKWEGKKLKKLRKKKRKWYKIQHYPSRFRFPGGESFVAIQQRAVSAIEKLCGQHEKELIALVSHADLIKLVMSHYFGSHIDLFQRINISPASASLLSLSKGGPVRIMRVNDNGPIQLPSPKKDKKANEDIADNRKQAAPVAGGMMNSSSSEYL
jgi:probable phosphoglycerate mutase